MANAWLSHVKHTMKAHKGMKFGQVLKLAKKTYKGGADVAPATASDVGESSLGSAPVGGRRRTRRGRKSRKSRRSY
jgi:hypothetical protein